MAMRRADTIAFDRPGGESCPGPTKRPIDLAHLSRQTMGDRALEQEVLTLFLQQAAAFAEKLDRADPIEAGRLIHTLKGSARGVGAFAIADCMSNMEINPQDRRLRQRLGTLIAEARNFIAAINR